MKKEFYDLPFDQFSRQIQVKNALDNLRLEGQSFKVLDVGGYRGATAATLDKDDVTIIDMFDVQAENYIKGDGTVLPFKDNEYDFVLSFDVIEHVSEDKRQRFLEESARVAKRGVVMAFPFRTSKNEYAEKSLNDFYKNMHSKDHKWLKEHIDNVIPDSDSIMNSFTNLGLKTVSLGSNDIELWILMQAAIFITSKYSNIHASTDLLNREYNHLFDGFDGSKDKGGNYRCIYVGLNDEKDYKKISRWSDSLESADHDTKKLQAINLVNEFYKSSVDTVNRLESENNHLKDQVRYMQEVNDKNTQTINNIVSSKKYRLLEKISHLKARAKSLLEKR